MPKNMCGYGNAYIFKFFHKSFYREGPFDSEECVLDQITLKFLGDNWLNYTFLQMHVLSSLLY